MALHKSFNQVSDKLLSVREFIDKQAGDDADPQTRDVDAEEALCADVAEWKDDQGNLYVSENTLKGFLSELLSDDDFSNELATTFQQIIDNCTDHTVNKKSLSPKL